MEEKIQLASLVLESFGNSKTIRNDNSSRFVRGCIACWFSDKVCQGKFMKILFDAKGCICGATVINYLLEKSRIVQIGPGERSYHIFYQLLKGLNKELKGMIRQYVPASTDEYRHIRCT